MNDYLIVGAGLFGATLARTLTDRGKTCIVLEKEPVVGGNCRTECRDGIIVHLLGPHIFHTNSVRVWSFVNRFASFNNYIHQVYARVGFDTVSMPVNMQTFSQLLGLVAPMEVEAYLNRVRINRATDDAESHCYRVFGKDLTNRLFRGYTEKQWGRPMHEVPSSVVKRIPLRLTYDTRYFTDTFQGIPQEGYSAMIEAMLAGVEVHCDFDYLRNRRSFPGKVIYSGPIDALFDYDIGRLAYRSMRFEHRRLEIPNLQGCAQLNYVDPEVPWTRVTEHKHFVGANTPHTIATWEFPEEYTTGVPSYPLPDRHNRDLADRYITRARNAGVVVGGRLASYQYYNMDQAIAQALAIADRLEPHAIE